MGKIAAIYEKTTVSENGEILKEEKEEVRNVQNGENFVKFFVEDVGKLYDLPPGPRNILFALISVINGQNRISLTAMGRKELAEMCGISVKAFNNYVNQITNTGILKCIGKGEFLANPQLFFKGSWIEAAKGQKDFKLVVEYGKNTRKIRTEIIENKQLDLDDFTTDDHPAQKRRAKKADLNNVVN